MIKIPLERVKRSPRLLAYLRRKTVRIYSGEHMAYWGPNCAGYFDLDGAGTYPGADALRNSFHCDPAKQISYEVVGDIPAVRKTGVIESDIQSTKRHALESILHGQYKLAKHLAERLETLDKELVEAIYAEL